MATAIFCWACASIGMTHRITANLRCVCGSPEVDLLDPDDVGQAKRIVAVQRSRQPEPTFVEHMTKKALAPVGTEIPGWDVYKGPMPGPNPLQNSDDPHMGPKRCPVCKGSGYDLRDHNICRECGGSGYMTPTTTPEPPAVARHNYPSTQTTVPFMGKKKTAAKPSVETENARAVRTPNGWKPMDYTHEQKTPLVMRGAACPQCANPNTHLVTSAKGEGWWSCPNCGPMANIDRHPEIDPYNPPADFKPRPRTFKAASRSSRSAAGSRIISIAAMTADKNPGLTPHEIVSLARETVRRYPEAQ